MQVLKAHLFASILVLAVPAAAVAQNRDSATFDIYLRGVKAAQLVFNAIEDGGRYSAAARMKTSGLLNFVRTITYEAKSQGRASNTEYVPSLYEEKRINDGAVRTARMAYVGGVPQGRELTPPRPARAGEIDPATQGGTWDVMTAIFAIFRDMPGDKVCGVNKVLYDGRRRARITMKPTEKTDSAVKCAANYRRLEGFESARDPGRKDFPFTLTYTPNGNGDWHVTRVQISTAYGNGSMVRR